MKIVKWADGTYSVRSNWWVNFGYRYADLRDERSSWWFVYDCDYMNNCKGTLEQCQNIINKNTVVKVINNKEIEKLRKYTWELKEELALYWEAKELQFKVEKLRKDRNNNFTS